MITYKNELYSLSIPVEKSHDVIHKHCTPVLEVRSMCYIIVRILWLCNKVLSREIRILTNVMAVFHKARKHF